MKLTPQQLGGRARAIQERKEALMRYNMGPHFCQYKPCHKMFEVGTRRIADVIKKKFCDASCSAKHNMNLKKTTS